MSWPSDDVLGRPRDLLRFVGRINRVRLFAAIFVTQFAVSLIGVVAVGVVQLLKSLLSENVVRSIEACVVFLTYVAAVTAFSPALAQRAHDVGCQAKLVLPFVWLTNLCNAAGLIFVLAGKTPTSQVVQVVQVVSTPGYIAFFLLFLWPGQKGDNQFGPAPKPS